MLCLPVVPFFLYPCLVPSFHFRRCFSLNRYSPFCQHSSSLPVPLSYCSRTSVICPVIYHHPNNRSIYRSIYRSTPRSINLFCQMPLVHACHHPDLPAKHGHPGLVLRHHTLVTRSQFIWMIRLLPHPVYL